jgi:hypothetical protein
VEGDRSIKFHFPDCGKLPPPVLAINSVSFSYDGKKENYLYTKLELSVDLDSRIALIGPNGVSRPLPLLRPSLAARLSSAGGAHCTPPLILPRSPSPIRFVRRVGLGFFWRRSRWARRRRASRRC